MKAKIEKARSRDERGTTSKAAIREGRDWKGAMRVKAAMREGGDWKGAKRIESRIKSHDSIYCRDSRAVPRFYLGHL